MSDQSVEFVSEGDAELSTSETAQFSQAVLHTADWTVETVVSQLKRGNIEMNPRFQRRDAWSVRRKSAFIESLILGLPVPQIVLAEKQGQRGKYIVLDGKQRLLSLLQFTGSAEGAHNAFRLSGLDARVDLLRKTYKSLSDNAAFESDLNAFLNYTVRTVVIRNWPSYDFLHLVFLRLNTGSVKLSPQELRQAMFPGEFSNFVDDAAAESLPLGRLLGKSGPDSRMRDVELLVRFLGFQLFLRYYPGRMKSFLDTTCSILNRDWDDTHSSVVSSVIEFNDGISALEEIFGTDGIARRTGSSSFNRAVFDALMFYAANPAIRKAMLSATQAVRDAYAGVIQRPDFLAAVESDTAGIPNTLNRLRIWGDALRNAINLDFELPELKPNDPADPHPKHEISFDGLGV